METANEWQAMIPLLEIPAEYPRIEQFLLHHSNLPGPRGNLTLADQLAGGFEREAVGPELWDLLRRWADTPAESAPMNHPREYLVFCAVLAMGAHYAGAGPERQREIIDRIRLAMNDPRWRVREAAAMACQRIAERDFAPVRRHFALWYPESSDLEKRGFLAALAHPPILKHPEIAAFSLEISAAILDEIPARERAGRRTAEFKALSKGLGYALSVFVAHLPQEGFAFLKHYAASADPELGRIIRSNLAKSRLAGRYGPLVAEVLAIMPQKTGRK
ncbi:HEAT repeat protein [Hydrogenispora ethanolica]|jgi:hypothetical protein|uniref:HEAT repeat protein n=1 Tax=Hydrogenispora ethanolica TaxID=1082276 RepID=A0A4R1S7N7_HYDET|nr:HEAT repeat domain-containing protein [Hydrogenispora ethanolica]TCL75104.1 HEAT repeat protein [Hydrogenispora ethanolica]